VVGAGRLKRADRRPGRSAANLYKLPMRSSRGGALFNAFPYPTKISPEAVGLFIATHTEPGETIFDGFAGSGTTGLGAVLAANPTPWMKQEAQRLDLPVRWGARRAVLYELGVLGSLVARTLCSPPDPDEFSHAAHEVLAAVEKEYDWLYEAVDPDGAGGKIRHIVWSDVLRCTLCAKPVTLWDACVSRNPANISRLFKCPHCGHGESLDGVQRETESVPDILLDVQRVRRRRRAVWLYGRTGNTTWSRKADKTDFRLHRRILSEPIPDSLPVVAIPWGDLHRSGYHAGMTHLHHFYTRRNLIAFGALWSETKRYSGPLKDALQFWLLSYNASHSTVMTRVVAKKGQNDLVVTSCQPGVLYISGLPVEKNVFAGVRRKLTTITRAFQLTFASESRVDVRNQSSLEVALPNESVDYVFTDPPFGGNIPYAEVNFINEAWLGQLTDQHDEVIISRHQRKTVDEYERLLHTAFEELSRILRTSGSATVVFHSSSPKVWNALGQAYRQAGFGVALTSILDKAQASFKQITAEGSVRGDPLILLTKQSQGPTNAPSEIWSLVEAILATGASTSEEVERSPQRIYSRIVSHYVGAGQEVPVDASSFYRQFALRYATREP
jgi:hypothetical protein